MFKWYRLRRAHQLFLESCRHLEDGEIYWSREPLRRSFLQFITPVPILSLHEDGGRIYEALQWLETNCKREPLGEAAIRQYHRIMCGKRIMRPGEYRGTKVKVEGSKHPRPAANKVPLLMKQLHGRLSQEQERMDKEGPQVLVEVLRLAVSIHQRFEWIHPFADGNGRVGRLVINHLMRRYDFGYVILPPLSKSSEHFDALEDAHSGNIERLLDFTKNCIVRV